MLAVQLPVTRASTTGRQTPLILWIREKGSFKPFAFGIPPSKEGLVMTATIYLRDSSDQWHCPSAAIPVTHAAVPTTGNNTGYI